MNAEDSGKLPGIKNVQIKLTQSEYDLLWDLAAISRQRITPFARDLFIRCIRAEAARKGVPQNTAANKATEHPFRAGRSR